MPYFAAPRPLAWLLCTAAMALAAGCAGRPEAPIVQAPGGDSTQTSAWLEAVLPAEILILGEQHDAAEHQQIQQQVVALLAARGALAALALEMADTGASTSALKPSATEQQVRNALAWNDKGWPWAAYGPTVMTAVRAGVPVLGANLPRALMRDRMADRQLDLQLPGPALKAQQQLIRIGHCNLLPESQVTPMARIQIAKDISMANTLTQAALPGKTVVLLAGSGHADRQLGVPQHLPSDVKTKAVRLRAGGAAPKESAEAFDAVWETPALPEKDYCEGLDKQLQQPSRP